MLVRFIAIEESGVLCANLCVLCVLRGEEIFAREEAEDAGVTQRMIQTHLH